MLFENGYLFNYAANWALLRNHEPVVIVSIEGTLYYPSGKTVELMSAYDQHNRRIIPMTTTLLRKWL